MKKLVSFLVFLFIMGCDYLIPNDDVLSIVRQDYQGNELRMNGYYYHEITKEEGTLYRRYALYRNGIIRYLGANSDPDPIRFQNGQHKTLWGVFQIKGKNIKYERWYPSSGGPLQSYVLSGIILNDTTFRITESYRMQKGIKTEESKENETYHFRKFSPKPDSTNRFIP
jgi:hypothetical protein